LRLRIRDLAKTRVRYGYFRIYTLLRREGWLVNHKRVYRLYREDGLSLPAHKTGYRPARRTTRRTIPGEMFCTHRCSAYLAKITGG